MDSKVVRLLKIFQHETGKDILSNLDEKRLSLLEGFYDSLTEDEQDKIDEKIISGESNDFAEVAEGMAFGMIDGEVAFSKPKTATATAEPPSSSALAVVPKAEKRGTDIVDEDIDPLILRLLGFDDVIDIDYDTYKTLLREKMAAGRMPGSQMPTEEIELLTNEFKRVKGKTGRFKVKAQKIKAESFVAKKKEPTTTKAVKALPGVKQEKKVPLIKPSEDKKDEVSESMKVLASKISDANNNIKNIVDTDKKKNKVEKKKGEKDRVYADKTRKVIREERAERGRMASGLTNALASAIAPVKGVLDVIGDFLKRFLIGTAIMELLKFLENPQAYINGIVNWLNGTIQKIEDGIKGIIKDKIIAPINTVIGGVNGGIKSMVEQINGLIDKIPGNFIPKMDLSKMQIGAIDPGIIDDMINLPRIPMMGTAQPAQPSGQAASSGAPPAVGTSLPGPAGQTLATGAKASWYNPGLGGINSGTGRADPNARTSTGERYDKSKFTAAAFPSLISKLPRSMTYSAPNFPGGRTLARGQAFNVLLTDSKTGKQAVVRINDVGSGVAGQDPKRMMDFSVATRDYFGAGGGPYTIQMAPSGAKLGPVTKTSAPAASAPGASPTAAATAAPPAQNQGKMVTFGGQTFYQKPDGSLTHPSAAPASIKSQSTTPSTAIVVTAKPTVSTPQAPGSTGLSPLPIPISTDGQQNQQTNVSTATQKTIPTFSAYDRTNSNFLVIKSIYNLVG